MADEPSEARRERDEAIGCFFAAAAIAVIVVAIALAIYLDALADAVKR